MSERKKKASKDYAKKIVKYALGGVVDTEEKPDPNSNTGKAFKSIRDAFNKKKEAKSPSSASSSTQKYSDGGVVKSNPQKDKEDFVKGATSSGVRPGEWVKNIKKGIKLSKGGFVSRRRK